MSEVYRQSMSEVEADIRADLTELSDGISQYSFLIECGAQLPEYPKQYRGEEYLIRECQVKTWLYAGWRDEKLLFYGDSESLIVRGALALIWEIYSGRSREETSGYHCGLLEFEGFTSHFTKDQIIGLKKVLEIAGQV